MTFRNIFIIFLLTFFSCKTAKVETETEQPKTEIIASEYPQQIGFVNDFEKIFTEDDIKFLENALSYYKENSNREIAIITIESVPENMEFDQYAISMSDHWNVGQNNDGNGLTVVLSKMLRKVRISTTDKTRNLYLSDEFCKKVIDETMIPEFKKGNYNDGILLGINELIKKWI
ncbi:TPM domain-containing protein [uncultured Maribacter sp.]|uniref:TPM domain-containing protein n=1 Tax=uncultured Maribacter sp. TaxID=431308 RepID=UPI00261EF3FC|nr:TPM domain-containing protein [uncultured Maribacter sp.]